MVDAERMAVLAAISARVVSVPSADLERVVVESLDDLLLQVDGSAWTLVLRPGTESLGAPIADHVLQAVEEAVRSRLPIVQFAPSPGPDGSAPPSVLATTASAGGLDLGVVVIALATDAPCPTGDLALVAAVADILGGALARARAEDDARRADDRYRRLLETSAEGVCLLAADGSIRFANKAFASLVGERPATLAGREIVDFLPADDAAAVAARLLHESARSELELRRSDGTHRWVSCSTSALRDDSDGALALAMMTDVTVRRAAEAALRSSEARFRALVRSSSDVIIVTDVDGRVSYASPAMFDVLGHDPTVLQGTSPIDLVHPEDREAVERDVLPLWEARTGSLVVRCRVVTAGGDYVHMEAAITNLIDDTAVAGLTITARDVSAQLELQARLTHAATHDAVTGLSNRRVFNQRLADALRDGERLAVLFADLDRFKTVNDELGHEAGDELLRLVGARLGAAVREGDLVVRHGGDEFAILCPGIEQHAEAERVADRAVAALVEPFEVAGSPVAVGVSIGITLSSGEPGQSPASLLAEADAAMYLAKSRRKGWAFAGDAKV